MADRDPPRLRPWEDEFDDDEGDLANEAEEDPGVDHFYKSSAELAEDELEDDDEDDAADDRDGRPLRKEPRQLGDPRDRATEDTAKRIYGQLPSKRPLDAAGAAGGAGPRADATGSEPQSEPGNSAIEPLVSRHWLSARRMTRSENSLRLGVLLVKERIVASDVCIALTGAEIARAGRPRFPVEEFLAAHGGQKVVPDSWDWRGMYTVEGASHAIELHEKSRTPRVVATLRSGARLIIETAGGPVGQTRSPTEHKLLRSILGRAVTIADVEDDDVLAVAVPRSAQTRKLAVQFRSAPALRRTGILILLVDRAGRVDGLQKIVSK